MAIEFRCSQCNQLLRVSDASAGKNARCPKCQTLMTVPAAGTSLPAGSLPPFPGAPVPLSTPAPPEPPAPPPFTPPPAESTDPFAFLGAGGGGGGAPPPPKPPGNPFGDAQSPSPFGGPATGSVNPYASPSAYAGYQPTTASNLQRIGLPWENRGTGFETWWETAKMVMSQTNYAFSIMRQYGGLGNPMLYALWGQGIGFLAGLIWMFIFLGIAVLVGGGNRGLEGLLLQLGLQVVFGAIGAVLNATLVPLIGAGIQHLALKMVGGANQRYETSFRVMAFVNGSFAWMSIIPICGPLVMAIWMIVAGIIGMAHAHECSMGKAVGAFFISLAIGCAIGLAVYLAIIAIVVAVVGAAGMAR